MVHLYASCLYFRIQKGNDLYCLDGQLGCPLSICQNPNRKQYVLHRWPTCLPAVYMSESKREMICIAYMVHLSASRLYVRIRTENIMYCLYGLLVCQISICQNNNRTCHVLLRWSTCLQAFYMS